MSDQDFSELQLRAMIVPEQVRWPAPDYVHWQRLHAAADEARQRLSKAHALMDEIDRNPDLSREGKERQRRQAAAQAIADFEASKTLMRAREAVTHVVEQWNQKVGLVVKPASNIAEATVHAQIRDRLAAMENGRMGFLEKSASESMIASAILTAPSFLSGLSDAELALVKHKVEQHVSPEIAEARESTLKAMKEAEVGWTRALGLIAERGGLEVEKKAAVA
jgi:hypothetical protein